jgi:nitrogen fixation NifU-like protein
MTPIERRTPSASLAGRGAADGDPLYTATIIEHFRRPRNRGRLPAADRSAHVKSDACGDELSVTLTLDGGRIAGLRFEGTGCAISQAVASIASEQLLGMTVEHVLQLHEERWIKTLLGAPVSRNRRACAALHLRATRAALGERR